MPLVLYGKQASPPCRLVLIVAKALGLELTLKRIDVYKQEQKTEAYEKLNPAQTIPTLDDNGFHVWESRAIAGYLVHKYGKDDKLHPKDANKRALVDNILYFDYGLYEAVEEYYTDEVMQGKPAEQKRADNLHRKLSILSKIVEKRAYAAGDHVTIADIALLTTLSGLTICGYSFNAHPAVANYVAKVKRDFPVYEVAAKEGEAELAALVKSGQC